MAVSRQSEFGVESLERRVLLDALPAGPEFRVNSYTTHGQRIPAVAMSDEGDFVVTWFGSGSGDSGGIFAQLYDAAGTPKGAEFRVNSYTTNAQVFPAVAMDADGDFVIAWSSRDQDGGIQGRYGVYAQRYNAAGVPQGPEFRVNTYTPNNQGDACIAMDADGDFVIAWESWGQGSGDYNVHAQRYNAAGVPQGPEFRVNTYTPYGQRNPSAAMDADDDFVLAWNSWYQDGSEYGVYAQRFSAAGLPQGPEFRVNAYTSRRQLDPSVAMDADGDFVVAWYSQGQDGSGDGVYAHCYNSAGVAQGEEFLVNTYTKGLQQRPDIAMEPDGDFVIAWESFEQDGSRWGVFGQRFSAAGEIRGGEFHINTSTANDQAFPVIAMDADGDFIVTWESYSPVPDYVDVYAQRFVPVVAPSVIGSAFHFATAPQRLSFAFDQDVSASLGLDDIIVRALPTGAIIEPLALAFDASTNTATVNFDGILPDASYRTTLSAGGITGTGGKPMADDYIFDFHFLRGDANNDGRVNLGDFNILAANFAQSPRDFSQGDFNYDGVVNLLDFNLLAARFGQQVAPAGAASEGASRPRAGERIAEEIGLVRMEEPRLS